MLNFHDYQVHQGSPLPISAIFYPEMKMVNVRNFRFLHSNINETRIYVSNM